MSELQQPGGHQTALKSLPQVGAFLVLAAGLVVGGAPLAAAQGDMVASFTTEQADRGEDAYKDNCAVCHAGNMAGDAEAPGLKGSGFRNRWFAGTADMFFGFMTAAMPQQSPGSLDPQEYADIMAYVLQENGYAAGDAELPSDPAELSKLTLPAAE